ncbi:MAG: serine/threonine protein kinase [Myxococcales bacterium]|nr:serine/threonine protein kinase [Myxococcales bacterium]
MNRTGKNGRQARPDLDSAPMDTWPDNSARVPNAQTQDTWPDTRQSGQLSSRMLRDNQESVATLPPDPLVGKILDGRYEVQHVIGAGGMGVVYQARHTTLGKLLAVKVLRGDHLDTSSMRRFKQEAQSASAIGHEHIVDVMDFGALPDGSTYFVMEYLAGISLKAALNASRTPFSVTRAIHVARQIGAALAEAHVRGVVHRDLKPDNVFLVKRGDDSDFVKVLDFGIAKVNSGTSTLTRAGQVFGTPHYMAPEQCAGTHVDARTDIYALGVILYEMVSGSVPFEADNWMAILSLHLYEPPQMLAEQPLAKNLPPALEAIIMKCLAKDPEHRYASMPDLIVDLERVYDGASNPRELGLNLKLVQRLSRPSELPLRRKPGAARWRSLAGALLALLLVAAGVAVGIIMTRRNERAASTATAMPKPMAVGTAASIPATTVSETVRVTTEPEKAQVLEAGMLLGTTPLEVPRPLGEAERDLELRKPGYAARRLRIFSNTPSAVQVALSRKAPFTKPSRNSTKKPGAKPQENDGELRNPWTE